MLLEYHANINAKDTYGDTALIVMCRNNNGLYNNIIKLLLDNNANVLTKNVYSQDALMKVCCNTKDKNDELNIIKNETCNYDIIKLLIDNKADPNNVDKYNNNSIDYFCRYYNDSEINIKCLNLLMNNTKLGKCDNAFATACYYSKNDNKYKIIEKLIEQNININYATYSIGRIYTTGLGTLCLNHNIENNNFRTIKLLLQNKAKIDYFYYKYNDMPLFNIINRSDGDNYYDLVEILLNGTKHVLSKNIIKICINEIINNNKKKLLLNLLISYCVNNKIQLNV
jgi:ankyrin repeat protein